MFELNNVPACSALGLPIERPKCKREFLHFFFHGADLIFVAVSMVDLQKIIGN
jgi:hypothetical protein